MLLRFDPFREFEQMLDEMPGVRGRVPTIRSRFIPVDAYRHGDTFRMHFDVPGVDPDTIGLTIENDVLTVEAERIWKETEDDQVVIRERPQGTFRRELFLSDNLDREHIEARYDNGVLTVTMPLVEQAKARKIAIATGGEPKVIEATASETPSPST
jgi:HSP20 family protein